MTTRPRDILDFWLDEVGPQGWYAGGEALDALCRERFLPAWEEAMQGGFGPWLAAPQETLAYVILTDQLPRNIFRGLPQAFDADPLARAAAKGAIARGWDLRLPEPERQFFYLPLVHSESLVDQDRAVRLMAARLPETGADNLLHAIAHREQIRRFGRFPGRNAALGRRSTPAEEAFLAEGGQYGLYQRIRAARGA
jgi:uncharacterized protein (DUF924 family)